MNMLDKVLEYLNTGRGEEMTEEMCRCSSEQTQLAMKQTAETILRSHRALEADARCMPFKEIITLIPDGD